MFQKLQQYDIENLDTRFLKVKIWIMHLGENYNGSYFDKEVVTDAIPSLANTPILCFIEEDENGNKDFSDHRMELVIEDNKIKQKYLGSAIGLIPETNNAQFEKRICDDGVEREFLTVEGLIWTKWDEPLEIFEKNNIKLVRRWPIKICQGVHYNNKDQSRELSMLNYDFKMQRNPFQLSLLSSLKRMKFSLPSFRWIPFKRKTVLGG